MFMRSTSNERRKTIKNPYGLTRFIVGCITVNKVNAGATSLAEPWDPLNRPKSRLFHTI